MNYLEELQKLRKKIITKTIITYLFIVILFIAIVIIISSESSPELSYFIIYLIFLIAFGTFIVKFVTSKNVKEYKKIYKKNIILETFKTVFTDIKYNPESGLSESVIINTRMMSVGDRYYSNDHISAKYKNVNFEYADVEIQDEITDSDGDSHIVTIFKGQWFIFDFNKKFKANVQVCEKSFDGARRGVTTYSNGIYKKVNMENVDFNKNFKIYAENEEDAFYILTPNMMEKIKKINDELSGNLLFCFINSKLHIGLHNGKDLFEPNVYKKINLEADKEKILNEIKIITEFIDILDLDNDLFKRRD